MTCESKRGRPKGSGIDDRRHLERVAKLMVRDASLKKTPAIRQVVAEAFAEHHWSAAERRILRKWNASSEERLAEARERHEERARRVVVPVPRAWNGFPGLPPKHLLDQVRQAQSIADQIMPVGGIMEAMAEMDRIRDLIDPPGMRAIRQQMEMYEKLRLNLYPFD